MRTMKRYKSIILTCVIAAAALVFAVPAVQTVYGAQEPVKYVDENGTEHQISDYIVLNSSQTEIGRAEETWYVVKDNITFEKNLKVKDHTTVNLLLCDGKKMKCEANLTVNETAALKVWGQKETSGQLESTGGHFSGYAAIGGETDHTNGLLEFHSGDINAHLGGSSILNKGAAIGAGNGADGGTIRIFGGKVYGHCNGAGTGIGGGHKGKGGKIYISGGEVDGTSKSEGAGIGSGDDAGDNSSSEIIITGGKVHGHGEIGAGIGGGDHTDGGSIIIRGGDVSGFGTDGMMNDAGAGIGGGNEAKAGVINISGGTVTAESGTGAGAAMGCGEDCKGEITGEIYITGGTVKATAGSGSESAGIGGANGANGCHVVIRGGDVTATGGSSGLFTAYMTNGGAGIGGGDSSNGGEIEIYGGTVKAIGGTDAAGIGGGDHGKGGKILIAGGEVTTATYYGGAGIGGGEARTGGNITISGGIVKAFGGGQGTMSGAGIGGGDGASGSAAGETIHINGGDVTATGGNEAAGIGGGDDGGGANVIIDGGTVTAQGGKYAAGIGTGQKPADDRKGDGSLTVNGGNVTAKGGIDGAGIGGGENADGLKTTINGGYVYAKGQSYGAGIGGGENCKGGDVTINGGTVIAEAGDDCNCSDTNGGSAIGSGQGIKKDSDDVFGKFTLAESMMAVAGSSKANAVKILAGDRKNRVNNRNYALIRQCAHEEATSLEKDENGHKIQGCPYCGLDQQEVEEHVYREGKCRVCGYDQPRTITVTFDPGEHGTGTMEPYMAYPDEVYPLPKCGYDPEDGFAFTGWSVNENVKKAGQTIDVKENITVTAQWNAAGMNVWEGMQSKLDAGGNIKLENDIKAPNKKWLEALCIEKGRTVALDLNGYSIDMNKQGTTGLLVGGYSPPVNVTLKNGQIIDADASGVSVNEQSTLLLQDFTITGNSGFAIRMSMYEDTDYPGGGYISVAGKVKLSGNEEGGILLAKNRTINIADTLSEDSVIPVKLPETAGEACGIDNLVLPTKEQPRVITSGLKGKGNVECFTCDNKDYMIGETMDGEALIGIPTDITFDAGEGTSDAEHSMPEVKAACGGVYTLPSCGFEPPEKHVFQGWKAEGSDKVLPAGEKVTVTDELKLTACYEYAPQAVPVVLETGEGHEAIAQKIAESFNAGKEGSAAAGGSTVNIRLLENLTITGAEEKISSMMAKADISYDGEDGKSGLKWTGSVGQKPLSGYDSYKQYEEAECQNTPGHGGDPIGQIEEPQIKFYVHWNKPVTQIGLDIKEPVCGTEIKVDGGGRPDIVPKLTLTEVQPSEDAIASSQSTWGRNGSDSIFKGTMTGGEDYDVIASFEPAFGYYIAKNTAVTLNGKKLDADQLIERNSALELHATMTAVHDYGEAPTPVWTWNGYESATATFTCAADPSHAETFNDDEIYQKETRAATHTKEGVVSYTAAIEYGGGTYPNTRTQRIPRTDHEWGPADYTWMDDNRMVLAKRQCQLDPSHFDTEAVDTAQEVIAEPSCTEAGRSRFTAAFENEAFSAQTREEEIPALGHDWGEWTVTREATEAAEGEETRACSRCPETQTRAIPTLNHKHELRRVAAKEATCTEDGRLEYWVCDRGDFPCGRYFADQAGTQPIDDPFIRALGHDYQLEWNWNEDSTVATLTYVCANDEKDAGTLSADVRADETPATCEKAGKKSVTATVAEGPGGKTCSEVRTIEIPALGHSWSKWQNFDSAQHQRVCENDAAHTEKADHSWDEGKITVWPTMIREGVKTFTCQDCQTTRTETIPKITPDTPLPLTDNMVTISADTFTYNGRVQKPEVEVKYGAETVEPSQYTVAWSNEESTGAGTYTVTVTMREGEGFTTDPVEKTYTIEKLANPMTVKAAAKKVKAKKVKKKKQTVAALTVKGAQGKLTYKGTPVGKKAKKALKINAKNGKITVKKKTKKGTYKMKVKVTAAGNANYNAKTQTVTVKIKVK